jgi:hypothetical protein
MRQLHSASLPIIMRKGEHDRQEMIVKENQKF